MILNQFPDLTWLKNQTGQNFSNKRGWNNQPLSTDGWPTVILNVHTKAAYRPDIRGPLSLFTNIKGTSIASVQNHKAIVDEKFYFLSNQNEHYSLEIESEKPTETFNIHFGDRFCEEVFHSLTNSNEKQLDNFHYNTSSPISFYTKAYKKTERINSIIHNLYQRSKIQKADKLFEEEQLVLLIIEILKEHYNLEKSLIDISSLKASTKREVFKKLSITVDYLYMSYAKDISLEELSEIACLSKFHYLRLFKTFFKTTPYQFISQIRIEKAKDLLKNSSLPIHEISRLVGFEDSSTFSRAFKRANGLYPTQFQALTK